MISKERRTADICIVGAGPVGLKLAFDLAGKGFKILLVEAGGRTASPPPSNFACDFEDELRHHPLNESARQGLGGTSAVWGGRCIPFDDLDFADRSWAPHAQWPITAKDVAPFYAEACSFLGCGDANFSSPSALPAATGLQSDRLERWCSEPNMQRLHGEALAKEARIETLLDTVVTRIRLDGSRVVGLCAVRRGEQIDLTARAYVIAGGALETARLFLATQAETPSAFGGEDGALGRYYMGHMSGVISRIIFAKPEYDREFRFVRDANKRYVRRYLQLDSATQQRRNLLNAVFRPDLPPIYDASHRSGALSLSYLGLSTPIIGPKLLAEPIRTWKLGAPGQPILPHIANVVSDPLSSLQEVTSFLKARFIDEGRAPGMFFVTPSHTYNLSYHAEPAPSPLSRIRLKQSYDAFAPARLHVDLRFSENDARSIVDTHDELDRRLRQAGIGALSYRNPEAERVGAVIDQAIDGAHQIGVARMSSRSEAGVVDANCRVHNANNLFIAGSAVFSSAGQANPTLLAVTLAARLSRQLGETFQSLPSAVEFEPA